MADKTGKSYENLTQVVFQLIINQREFPNLSVERDVILQGKTTSHQIDTYWKFEVGGVPHEVIVQTKNWSKPVNQGQLLQFKSVLDDLPGQPRGIFVTRSGYQQGARDFALAHGILIFELKEFEPLPPLGMTVGGWATIKLAHMPLHGILKCDDEELDPKSLFVWGFDWDICTPSFSGFQFDVSASWLKEEYPAKDLSDVRRLEFPATPLTEIYLYDQEGKIIKSLQVLFLECAKAMRDEGVDQKRLSHAFTEPTFIRVASPVIPYLKISAVSMDVEVRHMRETRRLNISNAAQLVLHELNRDRNYFFAATPSVICWSDKDGQALSNS
jgi:hypothetical protein